MGNFCKQYEKEYIKITMLKHEETFRNQVHELHRLYRVQKKLMKDLKRQRVSSGLQSNKEKRNADKEKAPYQLHNSCPEEESNLELTLAIGSRRKMKLLSTETLEQVSPCLQLSLVL
ncbi:uncharacterized protein LOC110103347 [Dendrobium catenatum]|uniref:Uncharacterized protein n=1 Tax=Dendrobium catenatum TaxID=906689 RepID=A0A2I0WPW2_9ASPA|nr:uncharacterized protein LOC110103347 [Dendrobium catenatum]PKU77688.1 hypothetical protein MA16_Dca005520 [Dendrobium catenatum]